MFEVTSKDVNDNNLVSLLLTFNRFHTLIWCFEQVNFIGDIEQVNTR